MLHSYQYPKYAFGLTHVFSTHEHIKKLIFLRHIAEILLTATLFLEVLEAVHASFRKVKYFSHNFILVKSEPFK